MKKELPTVAIMYDFDKTLSPKNMQEYVFIPNLKMDSKTFWDEAGELARLHNMDSILAYMYHMIDRAKAAKLSVRKDSFAKMGAAIEFFSGVEDWFDRVNGYGRDRGLNVEHYIISSGLKSFIEGSSIAKHFKEIYACEFLYDADGVAVWPSSAVNYTGKTQFLFRINKGALDLSDDKTVNQYCPEDERPVPFRNMIYVGDGLTDVPCMKLVKLNGGYSIAVYPEDKRSKQYKEVKSSIHDLLKYGRVNFVTPANYEEDGELNSVVRQVLDKMAAEGKLVEKHLSQRKG